jgi:hypothetical protein
MKVKMTVIYNPHNDEMALWDGCLLYRSWPTPFAQIYPPGRLKHFGWHRITEIEV